MKYKELVDVVRLYDTIYDSSSEILSAQGYIVSTPLRWGSHLYVLNLPPPSHRYIYTVNIRAVRRVARLSWVHRNVT